MSSYTGTIPPYFPSFSEGLSLRRPAAVHLSSHPPFPFLFGGTFIEAAGAILHTVRETISLPFRRDFH